MACRQADDVAALEAIIARDGMVVAGSQGQPRLNAAVAEVRQGRLALGKLLGLLALPDEAERPLTASSRTAQKAANARWSRQRPSWNAGSRGWPVARRRHIDAPTGLRAELAAEFREDHDQLGDLRLMTNPERPNESMVVRLPGPSQWSKLADALDAGEPVVVHGYQVAQLVPGIDAQGWAGSSRTGPLRRWRCITGRTESSTGGPPVARRRQPVVVN